MEACLDGTNKIVEDIISEFEKEISKIENIDQSFVKKLCEQFRDDKAITPAKLEQLLFEENQSLT